MQDAIGLAKSLVQHAIFLNSCLTTPLGESATLEKMDGKFMPDGKEGLAKIVGTMAPRLRQAAIRKSAAFYDFLGTTSVIIAKKCFVEKGVSTATGVVTACLMELDIDFPADDQQFEKIIHGFVQWAAMEPDHVRRQDTVNQMAEFMNKTCHFPADLDDAA